jgi:2-oxoglutarate/2-oxoacid ferredoxin oxidoreductase subunit beta
MTTTPATPPTPVYLRTDRAPTEPARKIVDVRPRLMLTDEHDMCPGCGEPLAVRCFCEAFEDLGQAHNVIAVAGIGCYTTFSMSTAIDTVQALHGRAPSLATGVKRMLPDTLVFTLQGDGDMVNEGLQEVVHTAARGEHVTCVLLNNGVFGETGGHMTATTVLGQRTKNSLEGRDASYHGYPILIGDMLAPLPGTAYCARATPAGLWTEARAKRYLRRAFETQIAKQGFSFVEILTMCPTGWFIPTSEGPSYLDEVLGEVHVTGELKVDGVLKSTDDLTADWARKAAEAAARGGSPSFDVEHAPEGGEV